MQLLREERGEIHPADLFGHRPECGLVHMLELPPVVEGPHDQAQRLVANDVAQMVEELRASAVDADVVGGEIAIVLPRQAGRLRDAVEIETGQERFTLEVAVGARLGRLVEEPTLEVAEPLVQPPLAPLVVRQDAHDVVVPHFVHDQPLPRRAVVHHHREFGATPLDAVQVGHLRPGERPEETIQPLQRLGRARGRDAVAPGGFIAGPVQHMDRHLAPCGALVLVLRGHAEREVMHVLRIPDHPLATGRRRRRIHRGARRRVRVIVPLILWRAVRHLIDPLPAGVPADRHTGRPEDLILGHIEINQKRGELAVELAPGIERVLVPAMPVVHHDLGIPLRKVEVTATAPLPAGYRRGPRIPVEIHYHRIARREHCRQQESHDGAVRSVGPDRRDRLPHDPHVADVVEREVRVLEIVETPPALHRIGIGPAGTWTERIEMEMERDAGQVVGRVVDVHHPLGAGEHTARLVQRGVDLVADGLLPIRGSRSRRDLSEGGEREQCDEHGRVR